MKAITLKTLSKTYPDGKRAVDSVSLHLDQGEIFGFLGPNGAGKTTTVKLLNGMLTPTGGHISVFGTDPTQNPERIHAISGVVTEHAQMYDHLTGLQNLIFFGSVFGLSAAESKRRGKDLMERLQLSDAMDKRLSAYSTGMRQRLSLARALMHEPKVLFLDEPTSGLDPQSAQSVHAMIRALSREKGTTVFLCTHQLRYAQEICTRYGLMDSGRLLADGTLDALRLQIRPEIRVKITAKNIPNHLPFQKTGESTWETSVKAEEEIPTLVQQAVTAGARLYGVLAERPSLEDIYFALTAQQKGEMS